MSINVVSYALERYTQLLYAVLRMHPDNEVMAGELLNLLRKEKWHVESCVSRASVSINNEQEFEQLIQYCQSKMIGQLDIIFHTRSKHISTPLVSLCEELQKDLEDLLSHIERRYSKYFNLYERVPAKYLLFVQAELRKKIKTLEQTLKPMAEHELLEIVFDPVNSFLQKERNVSYSEINYLRHLVEELEFLTNPVDVKRQHSKLKVSAKKGSR